MAVVNDPRLSAIGNLHPSSHPDPPVVVTFFVRRYVTVNCYYPFLNSESVQYPRLQRL